MTRTSSRGQRGTSLIEAMIAIAVLLVGMAGFASLQVISVRANHFAKRISAASAIAVDITENVNRWGFNDARLTPFLTLTACTTADLSGCIGDTVGDSNVLQRWEMGTAAAVPGYYTTSSYLDDTTLTAGTWQGMPTVTGGTGCVPASLTGVDIDRDGCPEFKRYVTIYTVDPGATGVPAGKLVQVVVRWKEPAFGYRQVTSTAFKFNPAVVVQ